MNGTEDAKDLTYQDHSMSLEALPIDANDEVAEGLLVEEGAVVGPGGGLRGGLTIRGAAQPGDLRLDEETTVGRQLRLHFVL